MITSIFAALVAAFPAFAPLLVQVGLSLVNLWVKDQAQRDKNTQAFLDALASHANDAQASVQERQNAWQQIQDLRAKAQARDQQKP